MPQRQELHFDPILLLLLLFNPKGVSHAMHLAHSLRFLIVQLVPHFHSPGFKANMLPHPDPTGGADGAGAVKKE